MVIVLDVSLTAQNGVNHDVFLLVPKRLTMVNYRKDIVFVDRITREVVLSIPLDCWGYP